MLLLKKILFILLTSAQIAANSDAISKFKIVFVYGFASLFFGIFSTAKDWMTVNEEYFNAMLILVCLDLIARIVVDLFFRKGDFIEKLLSTLKDLAVKIFSVFILGTAIEGFSYLGVENSVTAYLLLFARTMIYAFPLLTLSYHVSVITKGVFPPKGWFKKWDSFNETLNINQLTGEQDNNSSSQIFNDDNAIDKNDFER